MQLVAVERRGATFILLLSVGGVAAVLLEELSGVGVATALHRSYLEPCPVGVQLRRSYESDVDAEVSMRG